MKTELQLLLWVSAFRLQGKKMKKSEFEDEEFEAELELLEVDELELDLLEEEVGRRGCRTFDDDISPWRLHNRRSLKLEPKGSACRACF